MSKTSVLVTLLCFWTILLVLSNFLDAELTLTKDLQDTSDNLLLNALGNIPIVSNIIDFFVPLFNIMFFKYSSEIPVWVSMFLQLITLISVYIVYTLVRGY